jgi:hypothetical protein
MISIHVNSSEFTQIHSNSLKSLSSLEFTTQTLVSGFCPMQSLIDPTLAQVHIPRHPHPLSKTSQSTHSHAYAHMERVESRQSEKYLLRFRTISDIICTTGTTGFAHIPLQHSYFLVCYKSVKLC